MTSPYTSGAAHPAVVTPQRYGKQRQDAELEALKQRGLAKILNKHFTETTQRLAQEKAAADAAVKDLEERKARTSEFRVSGDGLLSPLDEMCVKANQWRADCRRKERETILLYQRYVDKFGSTGMVAVPQWVPSAHPDTGVTSAPQPRKPQLDIPATQVPNMAAQIESTLEEYLKQGAVSYPSIQIHGRDQNYQSLHQKEEAEFRNFYRRMQEQKGVDVRAPDCKITERPDYPGYEIPVDPFVRNLGDKDAWDDQIEAAVAAAEAGFPMATVHEEDQDMCSIVSGLTTLHSAVTREVLQDCERSVATFLRDEQEHIRRIIESEDTSDSSTVCDASMKATAEAETMVQQMEEILNEYQMHHAPPTKLSKSREPRRYDTGNPDECWFVYYDDFYQQDYYHEKKTNRTQWEPPDCGAATSMSSDQLSHNEVMPDISAAAKRVAAYRRKRRKSRRRKLLLVVWGTVFLACASYYYLWTTNPDVVEPIRKFLGLPESPIVVERRLRLQQEYEAELERREAEAARLAALEELARSLLVAEEEAPKIVLRPWFCNIPLAYLVHGYCRQLANQKPWFDLQELINSMLQ